MNTPKWLIWLRRIGAGAFLFFLLKGIAWLVVLFFGKELFVKFFG